MAVNVLRTYVGSNGKKVFLVVIFCLLHCLHVMVIIRCVQWSTPSSVADAAPVSEHGSETHTSVSSSAG